MTKAWQMERNLRINAVPMDRRIFDSNWYESDFQPPYGDALIQMFWDSKVPGSGAPEIPYLEMVQAQGNKGFDVKEAEALIPIGLAYFKSGQIAELRVITAQILAALNDAPIDPENPIHQYQHPETWTEILAAMGKISHEKLSFDLSGLDRRIYQGWIGQLAGGSFGTAIEGYTGEQIHRVYGDIRDYITEPETTNDDVVYELIFLDVFEKVGRAITSEMIGWEWVKQISFGWSAEWVALRNLNNGIKAPVSGSFQNPYSHWIGAQMRGMICGMLAPGWPIEAARLAYLDGCVSHDTNGVYGEMYAAVLTALAYVHYDCKKIILDAVNYLPQNSEYTAVVRNSIRVVSNYDDPAQAWNILEKEYERYNWIHAYPNIAAVVFSLWYGNNDMTESFSLLAKAGFDVDCNGGLVGNVLGIIQDVPQKWAEPIADRLETYIKGKEELSIKALAELTTKLVYKTW